MGAKQLNPGADADGKKSKDPKHGKKDKHGLNQVIDNPVRFRELYVLDRHRIGEGSFASVFKATHKITALKRAIKMGSKSTRVGIEMFKHELYMMKHVDHCNIAKYFDSHQDKKYIYIVMQLCEGEDLFDLVCRLGHMQETPTAVIMKQVWRAVTYMHTVNLMHRDLKPENVMMYKESQYIKEFDHDFIIKVIDFGCACLFKTDENTGENEMLSEQYGGPYYASPQMIGGLYDNMADTWTTGILMYTLLAGYPPFYGNSDADVLNKVRLGNYSLNEADWVMISEDCQEVVHGLLRMNPRTRMRTDEAYQSKWIQECCPRSNDMPLKGSLIDSFRVYAKANKLKKAALYVMACDLPEEELRPAIESFICMDVEGDGNLGYEEIYNGLVRANVEVPADLEDIFQEMDSDGSGSIEYTEFLSATLLKELMTEDNVWTAFRTFDQDGDGAIAVSEMYNILNKRTEEGSEGVSKQEVLDLMSEITSSDDLSLNFPDFWNMMRKGWGDAEDKMRSKRVTRKEEDNISD